MSDARRKDERRFGFGTNWKNFAGTVDADAIRVATQSLQDFLGVENLQGKTFVDVGCGSGLFSLAALRLGATVTAFDYDPDSVSTTRKLLGEYAPAGNWTVDQADVLDAGYLEKLPRGDVVYSWGVLHHTGAMWRAIENARTLVAENGLFYLALYNDQGPVTRFWGSIKKAYNSAPAALRPLLVLPYFLVSLPRALLQGITGSAPGRNRRGMKLWYDCVDWIGGYPFEAATPEAVTSNFLSNGFSLARSATTRGLGCNEYLFRRKD